MVARLIVAIAAVAAADAAGASIWVATSAERPSLRVDARGYAQVTWRAGGVRRTLLVPPSGRVLPGRRLSTPDVSRPATRDVVPMARVVRRTPDGYFWALQEWAPQPGKPEELRLSRWKDAATKLTLAVSDNRLVGRATFAGRPVTGFTTSPAGKRIRISIYLDCFGCPGAGSGWKRMLGVAPRADGTYRVSIQPQWRGTRYRATVTGPNRGATRAPDARAFANA